MLNYLFNHLHNDLSKVINNDNNLKSFEMGQIVIADMNELKIAIKTAILEVNKEVENEKAKKASEEKLYTVNEVRKRLGKAHITVKKLVKSGLIKTTKDGLISEAAINEYLQRS